MSVRFTVFGFRFSVGDSKFRLTKTAAAYCRLLLSTLYFILFKIRLLPTAAAYCRFLLSTFFILHSSFFTATAQDIHFSQFQYSPLNLSAANTGMFDGDQRINAIHRRQWASVSAPYQTSGISYDRLISEPSEKGNHHNAGLMINNDKAGDGNFGTLQAALSYSYLFNVGKDSVHFFSAGIQLGFAQRSINYSTLSFDNQFNGDVYDANSPSGESPSQTTFVYADVNAGFAYTTHFDNGTWQTGISVQHINRPNQTFYDGAKVPLPVRYQVNMNPTFKAGESVTLLPAVLFMQQNKFMELAGGLEAKLNVKRNGPNKFAFGLGIYGRLKDAIIPAAALYYNNLRVGLSYDVNTSSLKRASNQRGGPEITAQYIIKKLRTKTNRATCCPVY